MWGWLGKFRNIPSFVRKRIFALDDKAPSRSGVKLMDWSVNFTGAIFFSFTICSPLLTLLPEQSSLSECVCGNFSLLCVPLICFYFHIDLSLSMSLPTFGRCRWKCIRLYIHEPLFPPFLRTPLCIGARMTFAFRLTLSTVWVISFSRCFQVRHLFRPILQLADFRRRNNSF